MKITSRSESPSRSRLQRLRRRFKDRRAVALVTVLTVMSLTTILVLTFFSLATSEHRASTTYSHGLAAHHVADQAVNMVIAQIREATNSQRLGPGLSQRMAWASQPGAIRTWQNSGQLHEIYKLYSSDVMKTANPDALENDFAALRNWDSRLDHFVDLNEPVIRGEKAYYPIVHPAALSEPKYPSPVDDATEGVEGFALIDQVAEGAMGREAANAMSSVTQHVAMPVTWIYQLADGTLGVLSESGTPSGGYLFRPISGAGVPSAANQIVARFAFWADDETSKLNINTHAGGLAWDVPKAGGELDMNMGRYQPAQREWQRYPGHPATVHLASALAPGVLDIVNDRNAMEMLFKVVPRVVGGGSQSGTRLIDTRNPAEQNGLVPDTDPLFPSVDDMVMRPDREPHQFPDSRGRPLPAEELSEYLERSRFFITATSRSPEVNQFNLPKIAMWPIFNAEKSVDPNSAYFQQLTPFDRLIHYCSTVGIQGQDYIFRREKADSNHHDWVAISRNRELYNYLVKLTEANIPGYSSSLRAKYGGFGQHQILTQIFDYIRSTNLHDDTLYSDFQQAFRKDNTDRHLTFTNPRDDNPGNRGFGHKGHGQVTPIEIPYPTSTAAGGESATKGFGRFFTLAGADVIVVCVAQAGASSGQPGTAGPLNPGVTSYQNRMNENASGTAFVNLPPLPEHLPAMRKYLRYDGVSSLFYPNLTAAQRNQGQVNNDKNEWPAWLRDLEPRDSDGNLVELNPGDPQHAEFIAAFDQSNWNWNLAFLDPGYRDAVNAKDGVGGDPTANKFQSTSITNFDGLRLEPGEKMVQATFAFSLFSPSIGWGSINPDMQIEIKRLSGMTFDSDGGGDGTFIGWSGHGPGASDTYIWATNWVKPHRQGGVRSWGGLLPFTYMMQAQDELTNAIGGHSRVWTQLWNNRSTTSSTVRSRLTPLDRGYREIEGALQSVSSRRDIGGTPGNIAQAYKYDLVTVPFKVENGVDFSGGEVEFRIFDGGIHAEASARDTSDVSLVQTVELEFPPFDFGNDVYGMAYGTSAHVNEFSALSHDSRAALHLASATADPGNPWTVAESSANFRGGAWGGTSRSASTFDRGPDSNWTRARGRMADAALRWHGRYIKSDGPRARDIVQSVAVPHGDVRLPAARKLIRTSDPQYDMLFRPHRNYGGNAMAHSLTNAVGESMQGFNATDNSKYLIVPDLERSTRNVAPYRGRAPLPFAYFESRTVQLYGDFDNGAGTMIDGAYINKPDEGNVHSLRTRMTQEISNYWDQRRNYGEFPYFSNPEYHEAGGPSYFSPNRMVSGPGMFGSLPTGVPYATGEAKPWQTLLFRPNVAGQHGYESHPGAGRNQGGEDPPDHVILDLFWMPVVEPYAISEPLSTAGKINLNYEIVPFLHIERSTALRGVFRSELILCVPNALHQSYKHDRGRGRGYHWRDNPFGGELQGKRLRSVIVESKTLEQFKKRFNRGRDAFKHASEICEIHLIPQEFSERMGLGDRGTIGSYTPRLEQMESGEYWRDHAVVGDNARERPYTNIHQRITTKSNTFEVHYRAQVLQQARRESGGDYALWRPDTDSVRAEYRGSSIVERFVNPEDPTLPDFATMPEESLDRFYQFRVVNPRRFAP